MYNNTSESLTISFLIVNPGHSSLPAMSTSNSPYADPPLSGQYTAQASYNI